jgi:endonuclease/exonuclease/phosphatase family metal-dependent hydrolase
LVSKYLEAQLNFDPTYKYDDHSDVYDTSEKRRAPAWCDRILYENSPNKITVIDYGRRESRLSDHRPVTATFEVQVFKINKAKKAEI